MSDNVEQRFETDIYTYIVVTVVVVVMVVAVVVVVVVVVVLLLLYEQFYLIPTNSIYPNLHP